MSIFYLETTLGCLTWLDNFAKLIGGLQPMVDLLWFFFRPAKVLGRFIALLQDFL
jgi:hypothetical protein